MTEIFCATLQGNVLDRRRWATHDVLRLAIVHWIERTDRRGRRQRRFGKLTSAECELVRHQAVALADQTRNQ